MALSPIAELRISVNAIPHDFDTISRSRSISLTSGTMPNTVLRQHSVSGYHALHNLQRHRHGHQMSYRSRADFARNTGDDATLISAKVLRAVMPARPRVPDIPAPIISMKISK